MRKHFTLSDLIIHVVLIAAAFACIVPVLNIIAISFSDSAEAATGKVFLIPQRATTAAYAKLITEGNFGRSFMISVIRAAATFAIAMPVRIMMAYALSKSTKAYPERNIIMWMGLFTMLFSGGLIPYYITVKNYGLVNTFWVLVIPGIMSFWDVILMMNFFRGIPVELEEAAILDGAGAMRTLLSVYLPVSLPMIATLTLFLVVGSWNDWFTGVIFISNPKDFPIQTYIRSLTIKLDFTNITDPQELIMRLKVNGINFNAAKIAVSMVPIICIYPFLQRYFVKGLVVGSVKG
jgi:putative aldouronate transport system permease protein